MVAKKAIFCNMKISYMKFRFQCPQIRFCWNRATTFLYLSSVSACCLQPQSSNCCFVTCKPKICTIWSFTEKRVFPEKHFSFLNQNILNYRLQSRQIDLLEKNQLYHFSFYIGRLGTLKANDNRNFRSSLCYVLYLVL